MNYAIDVVLFDGFELLDVFGPVEFFGSLPDSFDITYVAAAAGPVTSSQGAQVIATQAISSLRRPDWVFVPGGAGTRILVGDHSFLQVLSEYASQASLVLSVCTGSAVLAAAGLLDGYEATSNKRAFAWASTFGRDVVWMRQARWVHDRDRWTSSGVAAGMDMAGAIISEVLGAGVAGSVAAELEYELHTDAALDPFAFHADAHATRPSSPAT